MSSPEFWLGHFISLVDAIDLIMVKVVMVSVTDIPRESLETENVPTKMPMLVGTVE